MAPLYHHDHQRINVKEGSQILGQKDVIVEHTTEPCTIEGTIPEWINGTIYKQSGGAFFDGVDFLDGLAHIVAFSLQSGQATFTNKYMRTKDYKRFVNSGKRTWAGTAGGAFSESFLSTLCETLNTKFFQKKIVSSSTITYNGFNPNVNVWALDKGKTLGAATEADGTICTFDSETLESIPSIQTMKPKGKREMVLTSPAHYFYEVDSEGGYHVAVQLDVKLGIQPTFKVDYVIYHGDTAPLKPVYTMNLATFKYMERAKQPIEKRAAYQHTVACSANYFIMILSSHRMAYERLLARDMSEGFFGFFDKTEAPVEFAIFRRKDRRQPDLEFVSTLGSDFHGIPWHLSNCYEDSDGNIVLDASGAPDLSTDAKAELLRFVINLEEETVKHSVLRGADIANEFEFPNINPAFNLSSYRYSYCVTDPFEETSWLVKVDITGDAANDKILFKENHLIPSEPVFVAHPEGSEEDDGAVLVVVMDTKQEKSFLYVIDAKTFDVFGTIESPLVCNHGLHSMFVPESGFSLNQKL